MKAEIVNCGDEGRVIVSRIRPIGDRGVCLEFHKGELDKYAVSFILLTTPEARELSAALGEIAGAT
jgi:hypothetical protein